MEADWFQYGKRMVIGRPGYRQLPIPPIVTFRLSSWVWIFCFVGLARPVVHAFSLLDRLSVRQALRHILVDIPRLDPQSLADSAQDFELHASPLTVIDGADGCISDACQLR